MKAVISVEGRTLSKFPNLVRNDRGNQVSFTVRYENDVPVDLTGGTVRLKFQRVDSDVAKVNGICSLDNPTNGLCSYEFKSTDLNTFGVFDAELEVVLSGGTDISTIKLGRVSILEDLV